MSIEISTCILTPTFRDALRRVLEERPGENDVTLFLTDPNTHYRIQFYSKKYHVSVTHGLIDELTKLGVIVI